MVYKMCFFKDAFESSLGVAGGNYKIPEFHPWSKTVLDFMKFLFVLDPNKRPDIVQVINEVERITGLPSCSPCRKVSQSA